MEHIRLLVEGRTDKRFWGQVFKLHGVRYDVKTPEEEDDEAGGRYSLKDALKAYIGAGYSRIGVAIDINSDAPESVEHKVRDDVASIIGESPQSNGYGRIVARESLVVSIPVGLHSDTDLASIGVSSHAMEDYLVKCLMNRFAATTGGGNLNGLVNEMRALLQRWGVSFNSAKEWFQLLKPVASLPTNDGGAIEKLFAEYPRRLEELTLSMYSRFRLLEE